MTTAEPMHRQYEFGHPVPERIRMATFAIIIATFLINPPSDTWQTVWIILQIAGLSLLAINPIAQYASFVRSKGFRAALPLTIKGILFVAAVVAASYGIGALLERTV